MAKIMVFGTSFQWDFRDSENGKSSWKKTTLCVISFFEKIQASEANSSNSALFELVI